jgi:hypothetical protein
MPFKTDTVKLTRYANDGAVPGTAAEGMVALVGSASSAALKFYDGSWKSIDSNPSNSNSVKSNTWSSIVTLPDGTDIESLVYFNTTDSTGYTIKVPPVASYGVNAKLEIINSSLTTMSLVRETTASDQQFWWRQSNPSSQLAQIDIGPSQRALFLKTAAAYWEVIVLTL